MEQARALDQLAHDLASDDMLHDDSLDASCVHPIIQCCHPARARQGRKPGPEPGLFRHDLAHQDVGALRAAPEAALP